MKIQLELIKHYLRPLSMGRGVNEPDPMADLANFDADIREMGRRAAADDGMDWLRLSIESLILAPRGRVQAFVGEQYPLSDAEMVALLRRAHAQLFPEHTLPDPGDEAPVEFEPMSDAQWARLRSTDLGF